jgi:hypothetical protein
MNILKGEHIYFTHPGDARLKVSFSLVDFICRECLYLGALVGIAKGFWPFYAGG